MKTRQPKSRLKCIALLLLGLVATIGCQKTELDNTPAQQENFQRFRIEHYTVEDLQRNGKMETELGKLLKLLAKGGQVHAKDGTSPVGTDSIKYVEEYATGKHSYNFPMPADSLGRMRNLAMVSRNGSGYDAHVVVYGFSEEEFLQLDEVELSERGAMFSPVLDLDSLSQDPSGLEKVHAGWMCVEVWGVETLTEHNGDLHGVSHDGTCVVPGCRFGQTVPVLISSDCTLDTGGGTSDGGSWYPNPNGGQGNPHPGPGNGNVTTPASCNGCSYFDPENPGEQCLALAQAAQLVSALGLNSGQAAMIRSNCAFGSQLYNYLNNGGDEAFAIAAINAMPGGEVDWDDEIIYDEDWDNFPCQKLIVAEATGVCSPLTQIILDIFESNDGSNLIFKTSATITPNAETTVFSSYDATRHTCNTTITFSESYLQTATDISIARTSIHESLHAIFVYMYEENLLDSPNGTPIEGFENFVVAYVNYLSGLPANFGIAHHELMADFVEDMATSLSVYSSQNGYSFPFSFYKKLCWAGLTTTNAFLTLYPKYLDPNDEVNNPSNYNPEWLDIKLTIQAEIYSSPLTFTHPNGNTYQFLPKGSQPNANEPCD